MKPFAKRHASFLLQAVLASTVFCGSLPAFALTALDAGANGQNSGNASYPPTVGYDYEANGVVFTILTNTTIGTTGTTAVDNNFSGACGGGACTGAVLDFAGNATVSGSIGPTNPLTQINLQGNNNLVTANGNINATLTQFQGTNILSLGNSFTINGEINTTVTSTGNLNFAGTGTVNGNIGDGTHALNTISLQGAGGIATFNGTVNSTNLYFYPNANATTTAIFNNTTTLTTIDNQTGITTGSGNVTFGAAATVGAIGTTNSLNVLSLSGASKIVQFGGPVNANSLIFSGNANPSTTACFADSLTINTIDNTTGTNGNGTVFLLGMTNVITGNVGATLQLNDIEIQGATSTVEFQGTVNTANFNFSFTANAATTAKFDTAVILNTINNTTGANGNGILTFLSNATIKGLIGNGATNALYQINLQGPGSTVNFQQNINAESLLFSGTANASTTATINNNVTITGNVDNTTTSGFGTLTFLGNGTVTGTIGANKALHAINLVGPLSIVNFNGDVDNNTPIILLTTATANVADGLVLTASVDNQSGTPNTGGLSFAGNGTLTGNIGITSPLNLITINSHVVLEGSTINAADILLNDDGATATTLTLNNAGVLSVNANITARTDDLDILNITNPATIHGNIGSLSQKLNLIKIGGNTTLNGNVFAYDTQFQGNQILTIANSLLNTPVTTLNNNQGTLNFLDNNSILAQIGASGFVLNSVNFNGSPPAMVTLNNTIFATNTTLNNGGTLRINGAQTINGNLSVNNGILSLANNAMPLTVNGTFNLNNGTILDVNLGGGFTSGNIVATTANINSGALLTVENFPFARQGTVSLVTGGAGSVINPIPVVGNSLLLHAFTVADNINHKLNLIVNVDSPTQFANQSNTIGVAKTIAVLAEDPFLTGTLQEILQNLLMLTTVEQLESALAQLAPTVDGGLLYESYNTNLQTFDVISSQLNNNFYTKVRQLAAIRALQGMNAGDEPEPNRGTWVKVFGQYADQRERAAIDGYSDHMWGMALGADLVLTDDFLMGISFSYADAHVKNHVSSDAQTDIDSYQTTLYGQYLFECPFYINGFLSYGYNRYNLFRDVMIADLLFIPEADFHGWQYGAKVQAGYGYAIDQFFVTPFIGMYYSRLALTEYTEVGAGNADLDVNSADFNILQASAGVQFSTEFQYLTSLVQPEIHAAVFYNIVNDRMALTSEFTGGGPNFQTFGFKPPRTSYDLGLSLTSSEDEIGIVATVSYDLEIKADYTAQAGFFRVRYEW